MPYRFAIIGCGQIASRHASLISEKAVLSAVCDTDRSRATSLSSRYKVPFYTDHTILLEKEKPDMVVVCTPNGMHALHAIDALNAGANVLCEKPMAIRLADGLKMIGAAIANSRKLFVVKQNRFNPPVLAVKALLDNGKLGRISSFQINCFWHRPASYYESDWRGTIELDGGTLFTQFSHFIDLLYWYLGEIDSVAGWRSNTMHPSIAIEDCGTASILLRSGIPGGISYSINAYPGNIEGSITLFGEKGTVKIGGPYLNRIDYFAVEGEIMPVLPDNIPANNYGAYSGSMSSHDRLYDALIDALNDPSKPFTDGTEALKSVTMIEQIYKASTFVHQSRLK